MSPYYSPSYKSANGISLTEYVLLGTIVIGIVIFPLSILGSSLSKGLGATIGKRPQTIGALAPPKSADVSLQLSAAQLQRLQELELNPVQVKLSDGTILNVEVPLNTPEAIATIGANGTTKLYANVIRQLGQLLLENQKIDEAGYNQFAALANQGHHIAQIEATIENSARQSADLAAFQQTSVLFEGQHYANAYELTQLIGTYEQNGNIWHMGKELQKLWDLHGALENTAALREPGVKQLLYAAESTIDQLASVTEASTRNLIIKGEGRPADIFSNEASIATHSESKSICHLGDSEDFGIFCPLRKEDDKPDRKD